MLSLTIKANEVISLLCISRKALHVYASTGKIWYAVLCLKVAITTAIKVFINY